MSFELYTQIRSARSLPPGWIQLDRYGQTRRTAQDLLGGGIGREVAVLIDRSTKRLAIRPPRTDDADQMEPSLIMRWTKTRTSSRVNLRGALRAIGIDPERVAGRWPLLKQDGLLIVRFTAPRDAKKRRRPK